MRITVRAKTNARQEKIEKIESCGKVLYAVYVKEPPVENRANKAVIEALAEHFDVPKSSVSIVMGLKSKQKVFDIKC